MSNYDVLILGAGAAGLMCAIEAGKRGKRVLVLEKANQVGRKILMAGGGRCNFTNYYIEPEKYISHNPHFCKSALSRYTQWDFIKLVEQHKIPYFEKTLGQLFCRDKAVDIVQMLLAECERHSVVIHLNKAILAVGQDSPGGFTVKSTAGNYRTESLVIATGGLSIPTMGSSPLGYQIAEQFGLNVLPTRAGLVPFTLHLEDKHRFDGLAGVSANCEVTCGGQRFREDMLFTHRGLSGPAMLQISSYWSPGDTLHVDLLPDNDLLEELSQSKVRSPDVQLKTILGQVIAKRVLGGFLSESELSTPIRQFSSPALGDIAGRLKKWEIKPNNTEGYRTAEVTLGGVDCDELSSKTFETKKVPGLYFIGEVLDVTGWLGGYNFQWAWSSGWAAGQCA